MHNFNIVLVVIAMFAIGVMALPPKPTCKSKKNKKSNQFINIFEYLEFTYLDIFFLFSFMQRPKESRINKGVEQRDE